MTRHRISKAFADAVFAVAGRLPGAHALVLTALRRYACSRNLTPRDIRVLFSCVQRLALPPRWWLITTPGGLRFDVCDQAQSVNTILLLRGHRFEYAWEPQNARLLLALVQPGDVVVFAGANVGYDALLVGQQLRGGAGRCYAFEPVDRTFRALERNIALNDLGAVVVPIRAALGSADGTGRISVAGESSSLMFHNEREAMPKEDVVVRRLETLHRDGDIPAMSALVMDVEGYEFEVAKGTGALLESPGLRFVLAEINRATDAAAPGSNDALLGTLSAAGFDLYAVIDDYQGRRLPSNGPCELKRVFSASDAFATGGRWLNVLALRQDTSARLASPAFSRLVTLVS